jgi:hypothetical protein
VTRAGSKADARRCRVSDLDFSDLIRISRATGLDVPRVRRIVEGDRAGVTEETLTRVRALARELRARAPASRRVRLADPRELGFGATLDLLDGGHR